MTRSFTEVLEEYLDERDRQNCNHYDNGWLGARARGQEKMNELAEELNEMIKFGTDK